MSNSKRKMISTVTFGCKVNQAEMDELVTELSQYEIEYTKDPNIADIVVVNTCAVTQKAQDDGEKYLKNLHKKNPDITIIATGCLAELVQEKLLSAGVKKVVSNKKKSSIIDMLELKGNRYKHNSTHTIQINAINTNDLSTNYVSSNDVSSNDVNANSINTMNEVIDINSDNIPKIRTRAFLKIQDGCDCFCTYCIIPHLRGEPTSKPFVKVLNEVNKLINEGYKEIVLTGIHIGLYGVDINTTFKKLLKKLIEIPRDYRVRFTSLYVDEIDEELIDIIKHSNGKLCPHFHLSLQSANDKILTDMGRKYTVQDFIASIQMIREKLPYANIGIDIIVGFPGEDEEEFLKSYNTLNNLPSILMLDYMHIFPYSARPGTPAASMKQQVAQQDKVKRGRSMRQIAQIQKDERGKANHNREMRVLSERGNKGHSDNYYLIDLPKGTKANQFITVVYTHEK